MIVADGTPKTGGHAKGLQKRRAATIAAQAKGRQVVPLDAPPPIED